MESVDLGKPYIAGFGPSQPSPIDEVIHYWPGFDPIKDVYRPFLADSRRVCKSDDMYSLGIVFMEIAMWGPLESIMSMGALDRAIPSEVKEMREKFAGACGLRIGVNDGVRAHKTSPFASQL
ncbi:hypothetical protein BBP40_011068 [Aspergillus hancockii]|nr:hypothetical protein BBP40_011068 [Aspergillus hancockii]